MMETETLEMLEGLQGSRLHPLEIVRDFQPNLLNTRLRLVTLSRQLAWTPASRQLICRTAEHSSFLGWLNHPTAGSQPGAGNSWCPRCSRSALCGHSGGGRSSTTAGSGGGCSATSPVPWPTIWLLSEPSVLPPQPELNLGTL